MKVLLIQPPIQDFYQTRIRIFPAGILYLASALESEGIDVEILDCQSKGRKKKAGLPPPLEYMKPYLIKRNMSPFHMYSGYFHFGMDEEAILEHIKRSTPDLIGFSSLFTPYHKYLDALMESVKKNFPDIPIIVGGPHVNASPLKVLASPWCDFILQGESENSLPMLVKRVLTATGPSLESIPGIGYKIQGKPKVDDTRPTISNLDHLHFPARHLVNPDDYRLGEKRITMLITSRGCPYNCHFCAGPLTSGHNYRVRSVDSVLAEMEECFDRYNIRIFDIEDDNFSLDRERAKSLLLRIAERFGEHGVELLAMNGLCASNLDEEILTLLKKAGFKKLDLSLVTCEDDKQKELERPGRTRQFHLIASHGARLDLHPVGYIILGLPGEDTDAMCRSIIFLAQEPLLIGPSIFYAIPGTRIYEECLRKCLVSDRNDWIEQRSSAFPVETEHCSRIELITLFRICRIINYIKSLADQGITSVSSLQDQNQVLSPLENAQRKILRYFLEQHIICGIIQNKDKGKLSLSEFKEEYSPDVVEKFFKMASNHEIRGVYRPDLTFLVSN